MIESTLSLLGSFLAGRNFVPGPKMIRMNLYIGMALRLSLSALCKLRLTKEQKRNTVPDRRQWATAMPADPQSQQAWESDRLDAATDEAIAACGGNIRDAVKASIIANEFLEICELMHCFTRLTRAFPAMIE
jgi:hypothetical protein